MAHWYLWASILYQGVIIVTPKDGEIILFCVRLSVSDRSKICRAIAVINSQNQCANKSVDFFMIISSLLRESALAWVH